MGPSAARGLLVAALLGGAVPPAAAAAAAPTRARALAVARAVDLVAADLPGFAPSSSGVTPGDRRLGTDLARCAGAADPRLAVANVDSADLGRQSTGGLVVQDAASNVTVMPSPGLAARDLAAIHSARGRRCLVRATGQIFAAMKAPGVSFGSVSIASTRQPAPGAGGSFAYRLKLTADIRGVRVPFRLDAFGFTLGRAEVGLATVRPFPAADEQRLFSLLLARARAHRI